MRISWKIHAQIRCLFFAYLIFLPLPLHAQSNKIKALIGGMLIDGFGGKPIRNSVIIIDGERIKAVGQIGTLPIPANAEIISTEGMSVLPGLWDMHVHLMINGHSDYAYWDWDKKYPPLLASVIMPQNQTHRLYRLVFQYKI